MLAWWLSPRGAWLLAAIALLVAISSVASGVLPIAFAAIALFVGFAIADVLLGPSAATLRVRRAPVPRLALRRPAALTYELENRTRVAVRVRIAETPVPRIAFDAPFAIADVPANARASCTLSIAARERGRVRFGALYLRVENRIGLLSRRFRIASDEDARVFPDLSAVEERGSLGARSTLLAIGLRRLRQRGGGSEFESLREYLPGDGFRNVDWKATARRGRMMVAQYEVERSQNVVLALDCGRLMTPRIGPQRKFDYALTAALSVARIAAAAGDNLGLVAFAAKPLLALAPRPGAAQLEALAAASFDLQPRFEEPDYETTFVALRRTNPKRSLIVLFTDIFDPVASAAVLAGIETLAPHHLVLCVLMNDAALASALAEMPTDVESAYRGAVAIALAGERSRALALLRARGVLVIDVPAPHLTTALMDGYLDIKTRGLL